jgi:hypothetical protein
MKARALLAAIAAATALWLPAAHAEIWGYIDDKGVGHFAAEKVDERYQLFFRGGGSFDTSEGVGTARMPPPVGSTASKLLAFFEVSPGFHAVAHQLREAAREQGIDFELLQALVATESGFDAQAVSPKGAIGLMQVLPATAERYGVTGDRQQPLAKKLADPRINIRTGARYLRYLIRMFPGRLELALAAYNAGEGAVQRAGNRIPNYPETQNYVKTVLQLYGLLKPMGAGSAPAGVQVPRRIRMEIPGPAAIAGRRNMPAGLGPATPPADAAAVAIHD